MGSWKQQLAKMEEFKSDPGFARTALPMSWRAVGPESTLKTASGKLIGSKGACKMSGHAEDGPMKEITALLARMHEARAA